MASSSVVYSHADAYTYTYRIITTTQWRRATQFFRKIYVSLYWNGCVWEGVGDRTELQYISPHSYGHNHISFPFSWAAQPEAWWPSLSGTCSHSSIFSLTDWTSCALSYIIVQRTPSTCGRHKSHSFNPSTVKVIVWYSSIGCTCYLHRCIFYFDSPTESEVNIQQHVLGFHGFRPTSTCLIVEVLLTRAKIFEPAA